MKIITAFYLVMAFSLGAQSHPVEDFLTSLSESPRLKELRWIQEAEKTSGRSRSMGMDLRLVYEVMSPENPEMRTHSIQARQEFIGLFTNPVARDLGTLRARMAAQEEEAMERELRLMARAALAEWTAMNTRKGFMEEARNLLAQIKAIAQVKFTTGALELTGWNRLADQLDEMDLEIWMVEEGLERLKGELGRLSPLGGEIRTWAPYQIVLGVGVPGEETFLENTRSTWPRLKLSRSRSEMLALEATAAAAGSFPAVMVMAGLTLPEANPEGTALSLGLEISLPTFGLPARSAMAEEALFRQQQETEVRNQAERELLSAFREYTGRISFLDRMVRKIREDRIPRQSQTLKILLEGYRVGRSDFGELLEAFMTLISLQGEAVERQLEWEKLHLALESLSGETYLKFGPPREGVK